MDKQSNSWSGEASNQGQSSNMYSTLKSNTILGSVENSMGNESGPSTTAGMGAPTGIISTDVNYMVKDVNSFNGELPVYLNISASETDNSAQWQNRTQEVPEAGRNQYQ